MSLQRRSSTGWADVNPHWYDELVVGGVPKEFGYLNNCVGANFVRTRLYAFNPSNGNSETDYSDTISNPCP